MKKKNFIDGPSKAAGLQKYTLRPLLHDDKQVRKVGEMLSFLRQDYPDFLRWYNNMILPGLADGSRQIYFADATDGSGLAGAMILKDTPAEKKICTLCVLDAYQGCGMGTQFVELAVQRLGTPTPMITVPSRHLEEFEAFFAKLSPYGGMQFTLSRSYEDYYRNGVTEYAFNGVLPEHLKKAVNG